MADNSAPLFNLTPQQARDIAEGKLLLMDVLGVTPAELLQYLDTAMQMISVNKLDDAGRILKGLAALDVKNPAFAGALASLELAKKNYDGAVEHAQRAIELDMQFISGYYVLGEAYAQQKKTGPAVLAFEKAFALRPTDESRDGRRIRSIYLGLTGKQAPSGPPPAGVVARPAPASSGARPLAASASPTPAPAAAPRPIAGSAPRAGTVHGGAFGGSRAAGPALVSRVGGGMRA